ncbi:MAG: DUF3617 domain-containing protein [Gammaproteobacteria bacterium]|nr:DUF3617 domain-containing protein [Gammaproteobacteria bacterium]
MYSNSRALIFSLACLPALYALPVSAAKVNAKPGLWEHTVEATGSGPFARIGAGTHRSCITEEQLTMDTQNMPKECDKTEPKISGNTVVWEMNCNMQGMQMKNRYTASYNNTSYQGVMTMDITGPMSMNIERKMSGHWIGPCDKK